MDQTIRVGVLGTATLLCGCIVPGPRLGWLDDPIVYQPSGPYADLWQPPGLAYEDVYFEAEDGTRLHGWYCPVSNPQATILYAHGNAGNLADRWPMVRLFNEQLGATALIFDYRGYGRSAGSPSEQGVLQDARAARRCLAERAGIPESEIVLYGQSLGGGVMVDLAARDGAQALILESTFTSLPDVANDKFKILPVGYLMRNRFNSLQKIRNYQGPLLMAHGTDDEVIPFEQGQELFAAANEPKRFVSIPGAGHNWVPTRDYIQAIKAFLADAQTEAERRQ